MRSIGFSKMILVTPSLQLKRVGRFWSCRVGLHHRTLGIDVEGGILWFWIGDHTEYDRLVG